MSEAVVKISVSVSRTVKYSGNEKKKGVVTCFSLVQRQKRKGKKTHTHGTNATTELTQALQPELMPVCAPQ